MKKIIIAVSVISIIVLTLIGGIYGYILVSSIKLENKQRECWKDIQTVRDAYNKEHKYISRYFYSPKIKTCLYGGFTVVNYEEYNQTASLTLKKLYTNEKLEEIKFCESKQDCDKKIKNEVLISIEYDKLDKLLEMYK